MSLMRVIVWNAIFEGMILAGVSRSYPFMALAFAVAVIFLMMEDHYYGRYRRARSSADGGATNRAGTGAAGRAPGGSGSGKRTRDPLPRTGVETGEIIAWRRWFVTEDIDLLTSTSVRSKGDAYPIWPPGEPMTGEPGDYDKAGVHAWKTKRDALEFANGNTYGVTGRVKLWGEVVEHERGYRAEYAKVVSLDYVNIWSRGHGNKRTKRTKDDECRTMDQETLMRLRRVYGVETFAMTPLKNSE